MPHARKTLPAPPGRSEYAPALDGVRAASILLVALSHAGLRQVIPGGFGVTVFFFISGWLIAGLLADESLSSGGKIHWRTFFMKRAFRLMPALILYVAISTIALNAVGVKLPLSDVGASLFYVANYFDIFVGFQKITALSPAGLETNLRSPFTILWSLAVEEHFYLLFPGLVAVCGARLNWMLLAVSLVTALALILRFFIAAHGAEGVDIGYRIYAGTDTRIDAISFGVLCAIAMRHDRLYSTLSQVWRSGFTVAFSCVALIATFLYRDPQFLNTMRYSIHGAALFALLPAITHFNAVMAAKAILVSPLMVYIGKISYSFYLYHYLAFLLTELLFVRNGMPLYGPLWHLCAWPLAFAAAALSYHGVEKPFLALRKRFEIGRKPGAV